MTTETQVIDEGGHDHEHAHSPHLQHHFDTLDQQFNAGKLGMWLFLATEILLFGGLFVAYAIYRNLHPEIFEYGHHFLDPKLGGINTAVLILSSFTMAAAVRFAQEGKQGMLKLCLVLTLCGACGFLGIKYIEYSHKMVHGIFPGKYYNPDEHILEEELLGAHGHGAVAEHGRDHASSSGEETHGEGAHEESTQSAEASAQAAPAEGEFVIEKSQIVEAPEGPEGMVGIVHEKPELPKRPEKAHVFFGIYYLMTGLHGIHVLIGMCAIGWVFFRSTRGEFGPDYFTPVDLVGLYWHLVDLIWIYLFPLLYLIH
ncbi:MAG: cytochrome c oxidase subunit 3 family protein [Candidatus Omnitrophica bacterium]|nr:cytochrome c oxidase subunit 3 family protein [Candidatus Omnitrophota bacterium]